MRFHKITLLMILLLGILILSGCQPGNSSSLLAGQESDALVENPFKSESNVPQQTSIMIESRVLCAEKDAGQLVYNGQPIELDYEFSSDGDLSLIHI